MLLVRLSNVAYYSICGYREEIDTLDFDAYIEDRLEESYERPLHAGVVGSEYVGVGFVCSWPSQHLASLWSDMSGPAAAFATP